jgi:hypothetical protein
MAASSYPIPLDQFSPDLIQAVARDAAAAADYVAVFLDALGLRGTNEGGTPVPLRLPYFFLLGLGAALRLLVWEQHGVQAHRDAGLPPADEAVRAVFRAVTAPEPPEEKERRARQLGCRVLAAFVERLAWSGQALLGADVELGQADEDALVDALARFLWACRHDGDGPGQTDRGKP